MKICISLYKTRKGICIIKKTKMYVLISNKINFLIQIVNLI